MATSKSEGAAIAARCRRIGWKVEPSNGRQGWVYRITPPNGASRVQIHNSPSDGNWRKQVLLQLERAGLSAAEAEWQRAQDAERKAKIEADRLAVAAKVGLRG